MKDKVPPSQGNWPGHVCACVCVFWRLTRHLRHFLVLRPTRGPLHRPPSLKCYYSVVSPSLVRMLLHFHLLSQVECEWCSFSNIRSLELPAAALHKYTTPVSAYNSLQAWKNSDFLYWPDSFAIPNSCMFSPPRILIFKFPFVSALFQWIANKNDSHFYNPWECREQAFQKNLFFSRKEKKKESSLQLTRRQDLAFTEIFESVKLPEQSLQLCRDGNGDFQQSLTSFNQGP